MEVCNWDKWQSFRKDRGTPPWIKVHRNLLTNEQWVELSDSEKGQLVSIWLLAADKGGAIPDSAKMIQKMCMLDDAPNLSKFKDLGFLSTTCQPDDNQMTTTWQPDDANMTHQSRVEESRVEESKTPLSKHTLDDEVFAKGMFTLILKVAEKTRKPDFSKWANVIRLMREVDGLELSEMADVFRWANRDEFWQTNILSATKFRKQFSTLHAKMTGEQNGNNQSSNRSSNGSRLSTIEQSSAVNRANHERTLREIAELEAQIDHERTLGSAES